MGPPDAAARAAKRNLLKDEGVTGKFDGFRTASVPQACSCCMASSKATWSSARCEIRRDMSAKASLDRASTGAGFLKP